MSTIILLEDDQLLNDLYTLSLVRAGYQVVQGVNSRDIVALAEEHQPVLIVTDLMMPDHEGMEGIFRLRKVCQAPVIAISSNPQFLKMAEPLVDATLRKPFSGDELRLLVEHVLDAPPA